MGGAGVAYWQLRDDSMVTLAILRCMCSECHAMLSCQIAGRMHAWRPFQASGLGSSGGAACCSSVKPVVEASSAAPCDGCVGGGVHVTSKVLYRRERTSSHDEGLANE